MAKWKKCDRCGQLMPEGEFATRSPELICIPCLNGTVKGVLENRIVKGSDLLQRDQAMARQRRKNSLKHQTKNRGRI